MPLAGSTPEDSTVRTMLSTLLLSRALNNTTSASFDTCDDINKCRKLFDIVWGCLATIFASTWVSVHPNVPDSRQGVLKATTRRLGMMFIAIIAPELIVFFAARQLAVARAFARDYKVSLAHGFFFSMGGFVSRCDGHPITTVTQLRDAHLGPEYCSDIQQTQREDIADRSKGDALSKGIALLQGLWFILQIIARLAQRLPISELEVTTLAFAVVNMFTWVLWWHKPLDVRQPILIGPSEKGLLLLHAVSIPGSNAWQQVRTSDGGPLLEAYAHENAIPSTPSTAPNHVAVRRLSTRHRVLETFFHGPIQGTYAHYEPRFSTAVPEFWSSHNEPQRTPFAVMLVAIVFGAIHCTAWNAVFPSAPERILWRVSAAAVAAYPALLLIPHGLGALLWDGNTHDHVPIVTQVLGIALYTCFRVILIVLSFTTLRSVEKGWLLDVDWTVYFPHL
ncbi:hypothetical protein MVEN_00640500 [Mycena venus]|uniref:Uncharacterized protein n=1 Tax=Mycena venus TaxID=2733690 RepID=A0A8H6YQW4_9AGAR|nr:hypothetical protein MVEN_00640500 [Mycena venus]